MHTPTQDNMKKVLLDSAQLYGLYSRVNFYSTAINAIDAAHYLYLVQYEKAAEHIMTTVGYMALPYIIGLFGMPHISLVYSATMTAYSGYSAISNAYLFYLEVNSEESSVGYVSDLSAQSPYIQDSHDFWIDTEA